MYVVLEPTLMITFFDVIQIFGVLNLSEIKRGCLIITTSFTYSYKIINSLLFY